ncbi:GntR family transcriptional regulator [Specibacter cremeus]|uniref:GntR family transcriptional regulator n=1 Tax=Specibacter cremeus TaxID=1629051 RepID=UPI000F76877C|nr:GntR family transcriptional regulator [Specibacter cremeus]
MLKARQVLADQVFEAVLSLLLDGEISTGSALSIDGLARRFDVSATPVREALARLEATGMVRREALRGYKVAPAPSASDVGELLAARYLIEPEMASLACRNASGDFVEELDRLNHTLDESRRGGDKFAGYRAYWTTDEIFHRRLAEGANNQFLLRAYESIEGHIQRFRLLVHTEEMSGEHTVHEHQDIVEAIRAGDVSRAREAMAAHIDGVRSRAAELHVFAGSE